MHAIFRLAQQNSRVVDPPGLAPVWDPTPPLPVVGRGHARGASPADRSSGQRRSGVDRDGGLG